MTELMEDVAGKLDGYGNRKRRYVGIQNKGLTCFMNAAIQLIFRMKDFSSKFATNLEKLVDQMKEQNPETDVIYYLALLGAEIHSLEDAEHGKFSSRNVYVTPLAFHKAISEEFPDTKMHDSLEFMFYLFTKIEEHCPEQHYPLDCLKFQTVRYTENSQGKLVNYPVLEQEFFLPLVDSVVEDLFNGKKKSEMRECVKIVTFPKYLIMHSVLYSHMGWVKKDIDVDMPLKIDLARLDVRNSPIAKYIKWDDENNRRMNKEGDETHSSSGNIVSMARMAQEPLQKEAEYRLVSTINYVGGFWCGHFTAYVYRDGKWVLFNDEKVSIEKTVPVKDSYIFLFEKM